MRDFTEILNPDQDSRSDVLFRQIDCTIQTKVYLLNIKIHPENLLKQMK